MVHELWSYGDLKQYLWSHVALSCNISACLSVADKCFIINIVAEGIHTLYCHWLNIDYCVLLLH